MIREVFEHRVASEREADGSNRKENRQQYFGFDAREGFELEVQRAAEIEQREHNNDDQCGQKTELDDRDE